MTRRRWYRLKSRSVNCRELGKVLQSYLDGDLEPDFADKISAHLENCRKCGLDLDTYQQIKDSLAAKLPEVDPEAISRLRQFGNELSSS